MESTRVRPPYSTFGCISLGQFAKKHLAFSSQVSGGEVSLASTFIGFYWCPSDLAVLCNTFEVLKESIGVCRCHGSWSTVPSFPLRPRKATNKHPTSSSETCQR